MGLVGYARETDSVGGSLWYRKWGYGEEVKVGFGQGGWRTKWRKAPRTIGWSKAK